MAVNLREAKAEARKAAGTGRHRDANKLLEGVVERAPQEWPAVLQLGDLYARAGQKGPANALYRRLADHYEEEGHHARAAAQWQKILRNDATFVGAHLKLGALYGALGRRADARRHYESALAEFRKKGREREADMVALNLAELEDAPRRRSLATARQPQDDAPPSHSEGVPPSSAPEESTTPEPSPQTAPPLGTAGESEFLEERLLQGRMFHRFNLLPLAQAELEFVLQRSPDHVEAREELRDVFREMGDHQAAVAQQQHLDALQAPAAEPAALTEPAPAEDPETPAPIPVALAESPGIGDLAGLESVLDAAPPDFSPEELAPLEIDIELVPDPAADDEEPEVTEATGVAPNPGTPHQTPAELAAMVEDFRKGVDAQVDGDDFETRYNLAIAYRGMGLLDEAVAEFQIAAKDPPRLFDCAGLLAQCFVEKGLPQLAVSWVERGLQVQGRTEEEYQELRYELAQALEAAGETERALGAYVELYGENARLRDVAARVRELTASVAPANGDTEGASDPRQGNVLPWKRG